MAAIKHDGNVYQHDNDNVSHDLEWRRVTEKPAVLLAIVVFGAATLMNMFFSFHWRRSGNMVPHLRRLYITWI